MGADVVAELAKWAVVLVTAIGAAVGLVFGLRKSGYRKAKIEQTEGERDAAETIANQRGDAIETPEQRQDAARAELDLRRRLRE